jgi:hypothetical protein
MRRVKRTLQKNKMEEIEMSKNKRPIQKPVLATFMATHNSCSSKIWHKL